jgi:ASC-1-like (ASCH) protein
MNYIHTFESFLMEKDADDPCWKGYEMVGMKKKGKKKVPNCVPENNEKEVNELLVVDKNKLNDLVNKVKKVVKDSSVISKIEQLIASAAIDPYANYKSIVDDLLRTFPQVFNKQKELQLALESLQES